MTNSFGRIEFIAMLICTQICILTSSAQIIENQESKPQRCDKTVTFGDIDICLPVFDNMVECSADPRIKSLIEISNYPGNTILAYYVNDNFFNKLGNLVQVSTDDYINFYVTNSLKGQPINDSLLNQMGNIMTENYLSENWVDLMKKLEKNLQYISVGRPVIIDMYSPSDNVRSFVMLTKIVVSNKENILVMTANLIRMKERMVFLAYYKEFNGEESIKSVKSNNDSVVFKLLEFNK